MTIYTTTIAKERSFDIDFSALPKNAQEKIIAYGVQRIFNDMVGGAERFPPFVFAAVKSLHVE